MKTCWSSFNSGSNSRFLTRDKSPGEKYGRVPMTRRTSYKLTFKLFRLNRSSIDCMALLVCSFWKGSSCFALIFRQYNHEPGNRVLLSFKNAAIGFILSRPDGASLHGRTDRRIRRRRARYVSRRREMDVRARVDSFLFRLSWSPIASASLAYIRRRALASTNKQENKIAHTTKPRFLSSGKKKTTRKLLVSISLS